MNYTRWVFRFGVGAVLCLLMGLLGCQYLGLIADRTPDPTVGPKYKNLQHQNVAVMVWADRSTEIDWPTLQLDLSKGISTRLEDQAASKSDKKKELEGTTFAAAESVVRFQRDHPEIESEEITDVAPRMDITRLIYVEIQQFSTRPENSLELFRGTIVGNLRVLEVTNGKAKVAYEEDGIKISYPKESPDEGLPGRSDAEIYEKTVENFATQVMNRFVTHTEPRE